MPEYFISDGERKKSILRAIENYLFGNAFREKRLSHYTHPIRGGVYLSVRVHFFCT